MSFWSETTFAAKDATNDHIWHTSAATQRTLQPPEVLQQSGAIGAQQATIPGDSQCVLPWVPDVLGKGWDDPTALIIVGSAYAGFIRECSSRRNTMPLDTYRGATGWQKFVDMLANVEMRPRPNV
jgi:hypothetical protein